METDLAHHLSTSLLSIFKELCHSVMIHAYTHSLLPYSQKQKRKQSRYLPMDEWLIKMWFLYKVEFYSVGKKNKIL